MPEFPEFTARKSKKQRLAEKIGSRPMSLCGQIYPRQINVHVESARK